MVQGLSDTAFILAAGLGSRLRPYTNDTPKPLVEVNGRSLLDRTLDHLADIGIKSVAANTHYCAEQINKALGRRSEFQSYISYEEELLDTGGGIKSLLQHFDAPFFTLSGDGLWENAKGVNTLEAMAEAWDEARMDILMLLQPVDSMLHTKAIGDYDLDEEGRAMRSLSKDGRYMFTSMRIHHPRIFEGAPNGAFSYLELMDKAQEEGRLYGVIHEGDWHHISTPQDLEAVDALYKKAGK